MANVVEFMFLSAAGINISLFPFNVGLSSIYLRRSVKAFVFDFKS